MSIRSLIDKIRSVAASTSDQGNRFEKVMRLYFLHDPLYRQQFSDVWFWRDYPDRGNEPDTGIDLVAKNRDDNGYTAIQCKCYTEDHVISRDDVNSFLVRSSKKPFTRRIFVSTTTKWSKHAEDVIDGLNPSVERIGINDLEKSPIDWDKLDSKAVRYNKKTLYPYQAAAIKQVRDGLQTADRGKLIMACGTGKTFTSLKIAEEMAGKNGCVLFLVPSLSLLSQTLREWTAEADIPLHCYAVCSDTTINKRGKNDDTDSTKPSDLAIPATTDGKSLVQSFKKASRTGEMTVVFSTYQSIDVLNEAQQHGFPEFDLIICDEAHRTTGAKVDTDKDESYFVKVHDAAFLKAKKRLYMTATPRLYGDDVKKKAAEEEIQIWSMDDEKMFGTELYRLGFSEAVNIGRLSDYQVIVLAINEANVTNSVKDLLDQYEREIRSEKEYKGKFTLEAAQKYAVKIVGCWNGLAGKAASHEKVKNSPLSPMKRAVAFTSTIIQSEWFTKKFSELVAKYHEKEHPAEKRAFQCEAKHIDGKMNTLMREELLAWLKKDFDKNDEYQCRILSNAKCLSEGVDVPALDAVMFLEPRKSKVDIVQSVGRVMRKAPGKDYGYIILPVIIPPGTTPEQALDNNESFSVVWDVLQALRAHDDRLNVIVNHFNIVDVGFGSDDDDTTEKIQEEKPGLENPHEAISQRLFDFPVEDLKDAIYAQLVQKCGERKRLEQWAKDVADIAQRHITQIKELLGFPAYRESFDKFWNSLRQDLNPDITEDEVVDMLSQHLITKPVFDALFEGFSFTKENPVSQSLDAMIDTLVKAGFDSEIQKLERFYDGVRLRASGEKTAEGKQKIIIELYDKFFKTAFPRMAARLGIVYTPVQVVDFMLKSVEQALRQEFGVGIGAKDIHVLDPFTGTGTFLVRLIQSGLIESKDLKRKYHGELHANEIVLLAYYIAAINIEEVYHEQMNNSPQRKQGPNYEPFEGIVLADTFRLLEDIQYNGRESLFSENTKRAKRQKETPIRVIISNPPYSAWQNSENDANKNIKYPQLDREIRTTYAADSTATNKNSLYDSYIRAFRWASDRIGDRGIVCFVSNGGYIDGNAMDGFRKHLAKDFMDIYCFNLRGYLPLHGMTRESAKKEGENVFGSSSRSLIAITLLIKNPANADKPCTIHYHDIGDCLDREEKLQILADADGLQGVSWQIIQPNAKYDWINQRGGEFDSFVSLGDKKNDDVETIFNNYSRGLVSGRDAWCYNFSRKRLVQNMKRMIEFYNEQVALYKLEQQSDKDRKIDIDRFVNNDPKKIAWDRELKKELEKLRTYQFEKSSVIFAVYRPFCKTCAYHNRRFNSMVYQMPQIFPAPGMENMVICVPSKGGSTEFSPLMTAAIPDIKLLYNAQCFPFYTYERVDGDYVRRENISDAMLQKFRERYATEPQSLDCGRVAQSKDCGSDGGSICKEDIFYYVYGILHSHSYRERFAAELKKQLPRIPMVDDFWTFSKAGRKLAELHLNYETGKMYPVVEIWGRGHGDCPTPLSPESFRMTKMRFPTKTEKDTIIYNNQLYLAGIPPEVYRYVVNGKSAIEWIMDRYQISTHKESGIVNDPNDWCKEQGNDRYIVDLIKRVVYLSVESVKIIEALPELTFADSI